MTFTDGLIKILDTIGKQLGIVIDWTSANVMPYIEELAGRIVNYSIAMECLWLVLAGGIVYFAIRCYKNYKKQEHYDYELWLIPTAILGIASGIITFISTKAIMTAIFLPEKAILQFIEPFLR